MGAAVKRSGHARLKAALVLRDALAAELDLVLPAAMAQLRTVENNLARSFGSERARTTERAICVSKIHFWPSRYLAAGRVELAA